LTQPARPNSFLPAPVLDALQRGNLIEAVKLMRGTGGLGLQEAKQALDAYQRSKAPPSKPGAPPSDFPKAALGGTLPPNVVEALQRGNKIEAIRRMREQTGIGLKEAKDAVELFRQMHPRPDDPSPGEVRGSDGGLRWLVILALVCLLGYWFFRRLV
jgi:ribosomal protein L7/L12